MRVEKRLLVIVIIFFLGGCATSGMMTLGNMTNVASGEKGAQNKNPLIEAELDLTLLDEVATIVKLNQIILERMPISYEDKWPELLNDFYRNKLTEEEKKKKKIYVKCLKNKLKRDFAFFRLYNPNAYAATIVSKDHFFYSVMGTMGSRMFIEGTKNLGIELEHTKSVLSYVPFGCECEYFSKEFIDKKINKRMCRKIKKMRCYRRCDFFNRPIEDMLVKYLSQKGGVRNWADVPVPIRCFRTVAGEHLGTFKEVFYSLLSPNIRDRIKRIDTEVFLVESELEEIKQQMKDSKYFSSLPAAEKRAIKKKRDNLKKELENKKTLQDKLYREALSNLHVTKENIKKAKKLMEIVNYMDRSFLENSSVVLNLVVKILNDIVVMKKTNVARAFVTYPLLVKKGVFTKKDRRFYEKRFKNIMSKILTLPITSSEVVGYLIAQETQVSKYKGYLKAMLKMEKKLKNRRM